MIAIGWTRNVSALPSNLSAQQAGDLHVLWGSDAALEEPNQRLLALQICFDAGMDILPLAPAHAVSLQAANAFALAHCARLATDLDHLCGKGQLSLSLALDPLPIVPPQRGGGRAWLLAKARRQKDLEAAQHKALRRILSCLAALPNEQSAPHIAAQSVRVDVLVPRRTLNKTVMSIRATTQAQSLAEMFLISGLWPPFSFISAPGVDLQAA